MAIRHKNMTAPAQPPGSPGFFRRMLMSRPLGHPAAPLLIDAVAGADGRARLFFGTGTAPSAFLPDGAEGCATPEELRAVAGSTMAVVRGGAEPFHLALADGSILDVTPSAEETDLLAELNVILSLRIDETPAQIAEGLAYHALHHGLQGALIVNRVPGGDPDGFAAALEAELSGLALTVVLLDCPVPLGKPGAPPESHPLLAPDAPGKQRMAPPDPDPWRALLGQGLLHEALKWRYLARARAVLTLDPCDILAPRPAGTPDAFDLCCTARNGVVLLIGRRIYPWRTRPGTEARFGDHICRLFEARRGFARWGTAPAGAGLENTWRSLRVSYAKPEAGAAVPFYRAMAIKVPGRTTAELVPKSGLIEDAGLLDLARNLFGAKPVRPPLSKPRPAPPAASLAGRTAIVTTMKNEGPFILEWIAWHRMIGVDDFLVYTNDCTDGTDHLLDVLQAKGIVQHRQNPYRGSDLKPQHAALQAAEDEPLIRDCGWGICMDVDEFINIRIGDGTLADLYRAMGDANMISLTWRLFGNDGIHAFEDSPVIGQFAACAPEIIRKPHQAWGFKTLFRNIDIYKKLGVHRPKGLRPDLWDKVRWLNGSGKPLPVEMFRNGWRSTIDSYGYGWVQLNHYAARSAESFLVKRDRGRVNHVDRDQGLNYWFRMNHNADRDTSIQRMLPRLQQEISRLMADPETAAAHRACVARHRDRIAVLRATPAYAAFYDELTSPRMEELCRMQAHFGAAVFAAGPGVIPDDIREGSVPRDFFFTLPAAAGA